ncbi:hypothetical protein HYX03_00790, partial [Candidatus Woesearchaeota archaeon]|nr:hypothetical protein [Candidatus Woesearchaeota archaeon]
MQEILKLKNLEHFIGIPANLEILEHCLDSTAKEYLALQKQKKQLNFGEELTLDR